jgi:hypothetical protein
MLERSVISELQPDIYLYRRFLDDLFAYLHESQVDAFQQRMNSLHSKIKFEFVRHPSEVAFLDLVIHKGKRFEQEGRFDLRVHQKKMNLYLYIPYLSYHTEAAKKSWIQAELQRYIRNSSEQDDYVELKMIFYQRLRDRGYPPAFLQPIFNEIFYCDRVYFLSSTPLHLHPLLTTQPPQSTCLIRKLKRLERDNEQERNNQSLIAASSSPPPSPPVFVIPYTPLSHFIATRSILLTNWELLRTAFRYGHLPPPIIAYQSAPALISRLVFSKAKIMEEEKRAKSGNTNFKKFNQLSIDVFAR